VKFLIDNALPPRVADLLVAADHEAIQFGPMECTPPATRRSWSSHEKRDELLSADSDFGVILASQAASHPSFILFREPNVLVAEDYVAALLSSLPLLEPELYTGCVAVFRNGRLRVRKLPFSDSEREVRLYRVNRTQPYNPPARGSENSSGA
jgi:predicted nuclease of predicted toxin-antitoxin system